MENHYLVNGQLKKNATSMSSTPEPVTIMRLTILLYDTGPRISCFDHSMDVVERTRTRTMTANHAEKILPC